VQIPLAAPNILTIADRVRVHLPSVYGMGPFPNALYREQWEELLAMADKMRENDAVLKKKEWGRCRIYRTVVVPLVEPSVDSSTEI
jgi:hypothetical protein